MPSASRENASDTLKVEGYEGHFENFEGGDAYYAPPGHTPTLYSGTEVVEFSPTKELQQTIEVVSKNMEAAGAA